MLRRISISAHTTCKHIYSWVIWYLKLMIGSGKDRGVSLEVSILIHTSLQLNTVTLVRTPFNKLRKCWLNSGKKISTDKMRYAERWGGKHWAGIAFLGILHQYHLPIYVLFKSSFVRPPGVCASSSILWDCGNSSSKAQPLSLTSR